MIISTFQRILSEHGKIRAKKTPNTDTFHAVLDVNENEIVKKIKH